MRWWAYFIPIASLSTLPLVVGCDKGLFASKEKGHRIADDDDDERPRKPQSAAVSAGSVSGSDGFGRPPASPGVTPVELEIHVMSQCPYGIQAEGYVGPLLQKLGSDLVVKVEYIGRDTSGTLTSLHGDKEVRGDLLQVCAAKASPQFFDFILCQNEDAKNLDTNWRGCAQRLGLSADAIAACADGVEGRALLSASFSRSQARGVSGSPTFFIGGEKYAGPRKTSALLSAVCDKYQGKKPAACSDIPPLPVVDVKLLVDGRCSDCKDKTLESSVTAKLGAPKVERLDFGSPAGKALFDELKPLKLPAAVFDSSLDADTEGLASLKRSLKERGRYRFMEQGDWNPLCADPGGCALPDCELSLTCRAEAPKRLDVFVMSQCPYGIKGMDAMRDVLSDLKKSGDKIDFAVHFIGTVDKTTGLGSMHGPDEVAEDKRQVCAIQHYGAKLKFLDYVWCRNKGIKSASWDSCTGPATGIDATVLRKCSEGPEGAELLEKSFAYSQASGVRASPTWLVNGKFKFSGLDAATIEKNLCDHNALALCKKLPASGSGAAPTAPSTAGPGCAAP